MDFSWHEYDLAGYCIVYTCVSGEQTDDELRQRLDVYAERMWAASARGLRMISILEFTDSHRYTARQRKIQSDWNRELGELLAAVTAHLFFAVRSPLMRGVITAVYWLSPPPFHYSICDHLDTALLKVFDFLASSGVAVDASVRHECCLRLRVTPPGFIKAG